MTAPDRETLAAAVDAMLPRDRTPYGIADALLAGPLAAPPGDGGAPEQVRLPHVYAVTEGRDVGTWCLYCVACTDEAREWVFPCSAAATVLAQPPQVLAAPADSPGDGGEGLPDEIRERALTAVVDEHFRALHEAGVCVEPSKISERTRGIVRTQVQDNVAVAATIGYSAGLAAGRADERAAAARRDSALRNVIVHVKRARDHRATDSLAMTGVMLALGQLTDDDLAVIGADRGEHLDD